MPMAKDWAHAASQLVFVASLASLTSFTGCANSVIENVPLTVELLRRTPASSTFALEEIADVEWATDSTLFLSIARGRELVLVRWDGTLQRRVSGKGRGPGEVLWAPWLLRRNDSTLVSIDIRQLRMSWWSIAGDLVHESSFELPFIAGAWSTPDGIFLRAALTPQWWFVWFDDSGRVVEKRGFTSEAISPNTTCPSCVMAVSPHGSIAMAAADTSYRFLRTSADGDSLPAAGRPEIPRAQLSASQRDSLGGEAQKVEAMLNRLDAPDRIRTRFMSRMDPEFLPRFMARSVRLDESESLWIQRYVTGGDSAEVDVFDARSKYLGTVRFAPGTVLRRVSNGRILTSHTDDAVRTTIVEYRLVMP